MIKEPIVPLLDLVMCLSSAVDLVSPLVTNHHQQVAYIAFCLGSELGLPIKQRNELGIAGLVHDVGALTLKARLSLLNFDVENPHVHSEYGYLLLRMLDSFSVIADIVRFHHVPWKNGNGSYFDGNVVSMGSHILHLADRVAVLIDKKQEILGQVKKIVKMVGVHSGDMFMPRLVEAFNKLAKKEYFWLDASYTHLNETISRALSNELIELDVERQLSLTNIIRQIIDFRSSVTATHSSGVATVAEELGRLAGFSERECGMMRMAGYLHDLGKLAVPAEILEKPGKLTKKEFNVVRGHTFYTYRILEPIAAFSTVNNWASLHHERLDGTGYPFKIKGADLSLGARIIAVADVFSAITEDRPYRKGMSSKGALGVLQRMADNSRLDPIIVSLLSHNFAAIDSLRTAAQATAAEEYRQFYQG